MPDDNSLEPRSEIVFYQEEDGRSRIQVLPGEGELLAEATIRNYRIVPGRLNPGTVSRRQRGNGAPRMEVLEICPGR